MFAGNSLPPAGMIHPRNNVRGWLHWLIIVLPVLLVLPAPAAAGEAFIAEETLSRSFDAPVTPRILVETFNGSIVVSAAAGRTVAASVTRRGAGDTPEAARADLDQVEVTMTQDGNTIRIAARRSLSRPGPNSGASVELTVPARAALEAVTSNGIVAASGVTGNVRVVASNGGIDIAGASGRLNLRTSNGPIRIEASNAVVNATTTNAKIDFKGTVSGGNHVFKTLNGPIDITLPADARFKINASSWNGKVSSAFRVKPGGITSSTSVNGTVGDDPDVSIIAEAINGDVLLKRGQ